MVLGIVAVCDPTPPFDRLKFGSQDYATDLECTHTTPPLAHVRAKHVLASRLAGF